MEDVYFYIHPPFSLAHFLNVLFTVKHAVVYGKRCCLPLSNLPLFTVEERCRLLLNSEVQNIHAKIAKQHNSNNEK